MADLRNFNSPDLNEPENSSQNGMFLYGDNIDRSTSTLVDVPGGTPVYASDISNAPLSNFHVSNEGEGNANGKILAGLVVALMLGAAGVYAYTTSGSNAPMKVATAEPARSEVVTTPAPAPQQTTDNTAFTPSEAAPSPVLAPTQINEPAKSEPAQPAGPRVNVNSSASNAPAKPRAVRQAATSSSEADARANATTQAINQSMAENAARRPLPLSNAPDATTTAEPAPQTVAPTLPSEQPVTPVAPQAEPATPAPVQ